MVNSKYKFWILIGILLAGGLFINWFEQRGEASVTRKPLAELPAEIGEWKQKGNDIRFSEQTESVLNATEYVNRYYVKDGRLVDFYIGYYQSQKGGATYHSPQNCLPGAGWEMRSPELVGITTPSGKTFTANRYIVENGKYKQVMVYWYQGRGRTIASEYYDKIYTVWDSVSRRRSDGAMVRVMTAVGSSEDEATKVAVDISAQVGDQLSEFLPE
ncbi:MAG: EpsI family protein [Pyrinomonadaceae bacterium]|nr:EpsI family protein [Pyrinomonadaceae bacterium]